MNIKNHCKMLGFSLFITLGFCVFLLYLEINNKLDKTSLIIYSSVWQVSFSLLFKICYLKKYQIGFAIRA